jgi:hypothetical protein
MWTERALDAWAALERDAFDRSRKQLRVLDGPHGRRAPLWPIAHVLWAAAEVQELDGRAPLGDLQIGLHPFRSGNAYAATPRGRRYFDDNAWLGLAMLRAGAVTADPAWNDRAAELAPFATSGEAPEGGVLWAEGASARNTCSTASAAWLLLEADVADAHETAGRWLDWLETTLLGPDGLFADRIEDGVVDQTRWTYNQGAAMAALRRLAEPTAALRRTILEHWTGDVLWREPPAFAAIAYRALLEDPPDDELAEVWDPYLDRLVRQARDPETGWYVADDVGSYDGRPTIDQAAVVEMLALRSRL